MELPRDQWTWATFIDRSLSEFQALTIDYERKMVLLRRERTRWVMPAYADYVFEYGSSYIPEFVVPKLQELLGAKVDLWVVRPSWRKEESVTKDNVGFTLEKAVVLVRFLTHVEGPIDKQVEVVRRDCIGQFEWVRLEDADIYHLMPDARRAIREEIRWIMKEATPEKRLRWQCPEWMESTLEWMRNVLTYKAGAQMAEPVTVERCTSLTTVVIAVTDKGKFVLKCSTPWENDAAYTEALAQIAPEIVPTPVAVDVDKQVMISRDYGEILTPGFMAREERVKSTLTFVRLQQKVAERVEEVVHAGMPDFRLDAFMSKMDVVYSHPTLDAILEKEQYRESVLFYRNNLDKIKLMIRTLYALPLPATVLHNDLSLSNGFKRDCEFMFFDWVDGHVSSPLASEFHDFERTTYFTEWEKYADLKGLQDWEVRGRTTAFLILFIKYTLKVERVEAADYEEALEEAGDKLMVVQRSFPKWLATV